MKNYLWFQKGSAIGRSLFYCLGLCIFVSGCASFHGAQREQEQINQWLVQGHITQATDHITHQEKQYGKKNQLLYYLDRGLLELMDQRYDASILSFQKAKDTFHSLYTQSVTDEWLSWAINDYSLPYRGADYEYVLLNVFQAMNFLLKNDIHEALVEARDLDAQYQVIEEIARRQDRKHFADNGFARFFMGILFEWRGGPQDLCDAFVFYRQSLALYDGFYAQQYAPSFLKENMAALAPQCGDTDMQKSLQNVPHISLKKKQQLAEVWVVDLIGYSPIKESDSLTIPIGDDMLASMAFPSLVDRVSAIQKTRVIAKHTSRPDVVVESVLGADIAEIAHRDLAAKKIFLLTKAVLRPVFKALLLRQQKARIAKKYGATTGLIAGLLMSAYHMYTEQADTRSWQTLPAQIDVTRLLLEPGEYDLIVESKKKGKYSFSQPKSLGHFFLQAGEKRFLIRREW